MESMKTTETTLSYSFLPSVFSLMIIRGYNPYVWVNTTPVRFTKTDGNLLVTVIIQTLSTLYRWFGNGIDGARPSPSNDKSVLMRWRVRWWNEFPH